jgi:oligopeptide transport system substrate-binding protein
MLKKPKSRFLMLSFSILAAMVLVLSACGGQGGSGVTPTPGAAQPASADKQIARIGYGATDFLSLDPALIQLAVDYQTAESIFTGLVAFDHSVQLQDQLASSHSISADGLTYTFTLRPNLKFSDGTPLTSADVAYSINRAVLPATNSAVSYYLNLLKDFDKVQAGKIPTLIGDALLTPDANTIKIVISKPAAYFLQALSYPTSWVVEKSLIDKYGTRWTDHLDQGGGDGPFKVQSYSHTKGIIEVPNSNYYGPQAKLQKLEFLISGDAETGYNAYLTGQFDQIVDPAAHVAADRSRPDFHEYPFLRIRYLTMNYLTKPFDNIHIRQAFALAINKDLLASSVFRGTQQATNHLIPSGMPGYDPNVTGPAGVSSTAGDATKAKQLLAQGMQEAGYASISALPTITFTYYTDTQAIVQASQAIVQMWQSVLGITVKTQAFTFSKLIALSTATVNNPHGLMVWISGWLADYPDPQDWLSTFFQKGSGYNEMNYGQNSSSDAAKQLQVQQTLAQADVNPDQTARLKQYNTAEEQVVDDVGWISIYQGKVQVLQNPKLVGIVYNALQTIPPNDWGNIYITQ